MVYHNCLGAKNHYAATIIGDCLSNQNAKEFYKMLGLEDESELDSQPPAKKKKVCKTSLKSYYKLMVSRIMTPRQKVQIQRKITLVKKTP